MSKEILQYKNLKQYEVEYTTVESFHSTRRERRNPDRRGSHLNSGSERIFVVYCQKENRTKDRYREHVAWSEIRAVEILLSVQ